MADAYKIVVCGEGGQGVLSVAKIVAYASWLNGKQAVYVPYFSTEKRGGLSMAYAMIGDEYIAYPKFRHADTAVALSQRSIARLIPYLAPETVVIVNSALVHDVSALKKWKTVEIDAGGIAKTQLKKPRTFNMIMLGAMLKFMPGVEMGSFAKALDKTFKDKYAKDPSLKELNAKALDLGYKAAS